ncbi:hypothetical protein Tcan_15108 [Toxocara canis]|uniref:RYYR-CCHC domain-containing protein n=1 Tax=Toxocara canis TaxID=6265 RepID=A0A0B2W169_TOXCA|nr:hypothetical protein Tcan_15108 [Toxocara canis]
METSNSIIADQSGETNKVYLGLSQNLKTDALIIYNASGDARMYRASFQRNHTKYYRCSRCDTIRRRRGEGEVAKLKVVRGVVEGDKFPKHNPECAPLRYEEVQALMLDRSARREVKGLKCNPKDAWQKGFERAMQLALSANGPPGSRLSIATTYPSWQRVRKAYSSIRRKRLKKATAILRNANNKVDHGEHDCDADEPHLKNSFINPVLSNDTTSTNSAPPSTPSEGTDVISSGVDEPEAMSPSHSSKLYSDDDSVVVVSKDCGIHGSLLIPVPDRPQVCGPKNAAKNIETSSLTIKEVLATQMAMKNTTGRHFLVRNPRTGRIIVCDMTDPSDVTQREQSGSDGEDIEERKRIRCDLEEKMNETLNTTHALLEELEKKQRDEFNSIEGIWIYSNRPDENVLSKDIGEFPKHCCSVL